MKKILVIMMALARENRLNTVCSILQLHHSDAGRRGAERHGLDTAGVAGGHPCHLLHHRIGLSS